MQFLNKIECDAWLESVGYTAPLRTTMLSLPADERHNCENVPSRKLYFLLRQAISKVAVDGFEPLLLQVTETIQWPASENSLLYSVVRKHFLSTGTVEATPGHLAEPHEREFVFALAFLAVTVGWGFFVVSPKGPGALVVDHDGNWGIVDYRGGQFH